jgi:hypothetical protein
MPTTKTLNAFTTLTLHLEAGLIGPTREDMNGQIASCQYKYPSGNMCAVGAIVSDQTLQELSRYGSNGKEVHLLPPPLLEKVMQDTGLGLPQLMSLQKTFDDAMNSYGPATAVKRVRAYVEDQLTKQG